ncbi:hypothetical protein CYLTODRAFT_424911 [Cylindrobasidium torrendii FP15055 ss-10]|uniref:Uncharacterized protein n=1 Tax=Cylindrobasidium torrendii FP15055 ss-10 TaxID=1314674 RepID=A0A0D7B2R4_9AGAR|nr:hypothetical protein CYLTODRAFT_424911 [Cylindrobasidium torrendii FP15055 ss-10]
MEVPHAEQCISFFYQFGCETEATELVHSATSLFCVVGHQVLSGMEHGELHRRLHEPFNFLNVQPAFARAMDLPSIAFRPQDQVIKAILQLYRYNISRPLDERVRLDQSPVVHIPLKCTVEVNKTWYDDPLYTMHPHAGTTTAHTYPYAGLPHFAPRADVGLLSITADLFLVAGDGLEDPLVTELNKLRESHQVLPSVQLFDRPPPPAPTVHSQLLQGDRITSRQKRKQTGEDSSHPTKRTHRAAPSQPPKRLSRLATSSKASDVACSSKNRFQDLLNDADPTPVSKRKREVGTPARDSQEKRVKLPLPLLSTRTVHMRSSKMKGMDKTKAILRPTRMR